MKFEFITTVESGRKIDLSLPLLNPKEKKYVEDVLGGAPHSFNANKKKHESGHHLFVNSLFSLNRQNRIWRKEI